MNLEDIKKLKVATEKLTKWETTGQAFGHFENIKSKPKGDNIYEFFCCMKIIKDLQKNYNIELIPTSKGEYIFPESPAQKNGWAYFTIEPKNKTLNSYQICFGTNIKLSSSPKTTCAPDISFQGINSGNNPDENDVELIMDAKFKKNRDTKFSITTIREFATMIIDLKTDKALLTDIQFNDFKNMKSNCLISNGQVIDKHEQYCKNKNILQVGSFVYDNTKYDVIG
ncbi:hypothetical protein [Flavobacterium hercynium]|uniref:Uncharacterized protein n=1 Tax=Flavobacterium hercynium TaxID=387094 RepID=A0A226GSQ9_9FLAO|nr:hypothetical protein [Flavobacterium hercynium]OXA84955.1 hypothetical protein B0A66_20050 [Flavobacterium hercynium]SMP35027.1 hypothetical protein SAMN06265346_11927 [Flavobacterium hercynium]